MIKVQVLIHDILILLKTQLNVYCTNRDSSLRDFYFKHFDKINKSKTMLLIKKFYLTGKHQRRDLFIQHGFGQIRKKIGTGQKK